MMKHYFVAATAAMALVAAPAIQASTFEFDYVSLRDFSESYVGLVSQSASQTVLSFDTVAARSALHAAVDVNWVPRTDTTVVNTSVYEGFEGYWFQAASGYEITGVTVDFTTLGVLGTDPRGYSSNSISVEASIEGISQSIGYWRLSGTAQDRLDLWGASLPALTGGYLQFDTFIANATAGALEYNEADGLWYMQQEGYANISLQDVTVTFHTSALAPVPEPATYLMLGAGLALMAGAVRMRRRR